MTAIPLRDPTESGDPLHVVFDKRMVIHPGKNSQLHKKKFLGQENIITTIGEKGKQATSFHFIQLVAIIAVFIYMQQMKWK